MKKKLYIFVLLLLGIGGLQAQTILGPSLNRKALVAPDCVVNKIINAVGVGSGISNLGSLMDEDLDNSTTFVQVASVAVAVNPIISIKDIKHTYAAGTTAGFCIVAGSNNSVLSLDVVKAMSIMVYKSGELKETLANKEGQNVSVLGLNLIQIPGSSDAVINLTVKPTVEFDEIGLVYNGGVNLSVVNTLSIKYAFVGDAVQYNLITTDMAKIGATVSAEGWNPVLLGIPFPIVKAERDKLIDNDLTNGATLTPIVAVGYQGGVKLTTNHTFPAGTEVGFKSLNAGLLNLQAGAWVKITLYDANNSVVQEEPFNASVLGLAVGSGGTSTTSIISKVAFSKAELGMYTVLAVNLSASIVYYGFVREKPEVTHQCDLRLTMNTSLCEGQSYYQLLSNPDIPVKWTIESSPAESNVSVSSSGAVKNMDIIGNYAFRATAEDGCSDIVTITKGVESVTTGCEEPIYGNDIELSDKIYESSGSLVSISNIQSPENILDNNSDNYATYTGGLSIAENLRIIGVKKIDGNLSDGTTNKRVGFVLESEVTGLDADVLQFFQIRLYKEGRSVYSKVIDETDAISVGLIGSAQSLKTRYSISVPAGIEFDEMMLWKSGVLTLKISTLRIYYGFIEEEEDNCGDPMGCSTTLLSQETTGMYFNYDQTQQIGTVSAASVINNLDYLIDNDITTATIIDGIQVGSGTVIAVKTGRTFGRSQQLGIVLDQKTYIAGVKAGTWLTVNTYYRGEKTTDEFTNWNVLGLDVIGYGDKSLMMMTPTMPYDEVRLTFAGIAGVLDGKKIYGLFIRSDVDGDGIPDCKDPQSCHNDLTDISINPICENGSITLSGKGFLDTQYTLIMPEQNKTVPFKTSDQDGAFSVTVDNIAVIGQFDCTIQDGSNNTVATVPYIVHPLKTKWRTNAIDTEWNNWNNWTNGSPYCCTSVIIPSGAQKYPILNKQTENADENCCDSIHFEPGAEIVKTNKLSYTKAWVELELSPNRYYLLSAPLKNMYAGDMFIPKEMNGVQNNVYFANLDATTSPENRFNPRIYQRLWLKTAPGKLLNNSSTSLTITETNWSRNFNSLNYNYSLGNGFSLWVDNGILPDSTSFKFRFPKEHIVYTYYDDVNNITSVQETGINRNKTGRFIYEDATNSSDIFPLTVTITNEGNATSYFLVGNPFMSHIDIAEFLKENSSITAIKVYNGNTNNSIVSIDGELVSNGDLLKQIVPMQSFFAITNEKTNSLNVVFTEEMLVAANSPELQTKSLADHSLKIVASNSNQMANSLIAKPNPSLKKGVETLFDNEVKPSLAIFLLQNDIAYDILPVDDINGIQLGIYMAKEDTLTLNFQNQAFIDTKDYILYDLKTGIEYPINEDIILPDMSTAIGRLVLKRNSISNDEIDGIYITATRHEATIKSPKSNINMIEVYDLQGRKYYSKILSETNEAKVPINNNINILKIGLTEGISREFKVIGYN